MPAPTPRLAKNFWPATIAITLMLPMVLLCACGQQDLYQPPGSPYTIIGRVGLPAASTGIAVLEHHAFVAGGEAGLHSIDWSDPTRPVLLNTITTIRTADDVQVVRTFHDHVVRDIAHVVEGTEGISSFDITNPSSLVNFNTGTTATFGRSSYIDRPEDPAQPYNIYMAEDWRGVRHFESSLNQPGFLNYNGVVVRTQGRAYGIVVREGWGYCAQNEMGLCVLDLRVLNSASVELVSWADTPGNARAIALEGNHAFIADGREGLAVFRIDDGETPVKVAQYVLNGFSVAIAVRDGLCALAANAVGVHFLDVSDPADPVFLGTTPTGFATSVVFAKSGHCLVVDANDGLLILGGRGPFRDTTPPSRVTDLSATTGGPSTVDLTWTMTGDDRMEGRAERVDVRYSETTINGLEAWEAATPTTGYVEFDEPGERTSFTVTGLSLAMEYHFALRVRDAAGNLSSVSNTTSASTASGIVLRNARVHPQGGTEADLFTFEIEAVWDEPFTTTEVIIDGAAYTMSRVEGYLFRYETMLARNIHAHSFRFTADGVSEALLEEREGPLVGAIAYTMGSPADEPGRRADETQRLVVFSRELIAAETEVTQSEWDEVMPPGSNPSIHLGQDRPVDSVTWLEAIEYCNARSHTDSLPPAYTITGSHVAWNRNADGWRLPTEAEWEYLCRAGTETAFSSGPLAELHCRLDPNLDAIGWYCGNSGTGTAEISRKQPNDFGLHDMSGNVREWCWDWYGEFADDAAADPEGAADGYLRVCRGGSWYNTSQECRSAARGALPPDSADDTVGFRVVRTVIQP